MVLLPMPPRGEKTASVAEQVRGYIDARPVVRDALAMDIVNLSALTRQILEETELGSREAVLAACRRYEPGSAGQGYEAGIRRVLSTSKMEVRTHVATVTAEPTWSTYHRIEESMKAVRGQEVPLHVIQGSGSVTIITDEAFHERLVEALGEARILKVRTGLVEVNLRSPEVIEDVPGILAFLTGTLARRGVNFVEAISCYKDTMFVLEEEDLPEAFEVLNQVIRA